MSDTAIQTANPIDDAGAFNRLMRTAEIFSESAIVPEHFRRKPADCFVALQLANEMRLPPMSVFQNMHFVKGKAGWSSQYLIGRANASGAFTGGIEWEISGKGADLAVTAYATLKSSGNRVEYTVSYAMAHAEGWTSNTKYKTMPELMLRYRSASTLVGLYCPEVKFGIATREELEDIEAAAPPSPKLTRDERISKALAAAKTAPAVQEADVVSDAKDDEQARKKAAVAVRNAAMLAIADGSMTLDDGLAQMLGAGWAEEVAKGYVATAAAKRKTEVDPKTKAKVETIDALQAGTQNPADAVAYLVGAGFTKGEAERVVEGALSGAE